MGTNASFPVNEKNVFKRSKNDYLLMHNLQLHLPRICQVKIGGLSKIIKGT